MMRAIILACVLVGRIAAADGDDDGAKTPGTALALSAGGTAASLLAIGIGVEQRPVGVPMLAAGAISLALTPSIGEWYSGEFFTPGLGLRLGAPVAALVVAFLANEVLPCRRDNAYCDPDPRVYTAGLLAGGAMLATGIGYDIITAPREARRYNREHAQMSIVPTGPVGSYGMSLVGRF